MRAQSMPLHFHSASASGYRPICLLRGSRCHSPAVALWPCPGSFGECQPAHLEPWLPTTPTAWHLHILPRAPHLLKRERTEEKGEETNPIPGDTCAPVTSWAAARKTEHSPAGSRSLCRHFQQLSSGQREPRMGSWERRQEMQPREAPARRLIFKAECFCYFWSQLT